MKRLCATILLLMLGLCALAVEKSGTIVYINGSKYYVHTVQLGETLYGLSKTYDVGESVILKYNPEISRGLQTGDAVKIPFVTKGISRKSERKLRKTFKTHTVKQGETLYGISRRYEIPIQTVVEDNPSVDPAHLRLGEELLIRKKKIGSEDEAEIKEQWEGYRNSLNSVADEGFAYHIVKPGETFYSLARRFGTTEEQLGVLNGGLKPADLKAGAIIKIPGSAEKEIADSNSFQHIDSIAVDSILADTIVKPREIEFRALRRSTPLKVALMLPVISHSEPNSNYLEFYQGFLLGLDSVRTNYGVSIDVTLYNAGRNPQTIQTILESDSFRQTNLIVGPVYEEGLEPVIQYAEQHEVPVVSPLANITEVNSDVLFQMAPDPTKKWDKVADLFDGSKAVTLIYSGSTDKDFEAEILSLLGNSDYRKYTYTYVHPSMRPAHNPSDLTPLLENTRDNVFIIMTDDEVDVERILAAMASANSNLIARGRTTPRFVVMGNARWNRYSNLDRTVFFKDRVIFVSTYHAKRDSQAILNFDSSYIRAFGTLPSLYSYRGYDAALVFCPAMYSDIELKLVGADYLPLQTAYRFGKDSERMNHINQNWMRVNYNSDFTITIE